eukprot:Gregarina_sp_Poly_1__1497@NODE_1376_length_4266_cov_52_069540_g920_i0_p2_GENE_NODE_1376_length_4266_cov_52_069540_g920_i0NODE_1376_length_4266_cov_52_069540_g920_i0_p2_ORF_typecomplete_len336_score29_25IIGP/PF05049_13/1_6e03IIGP/PF05049_13/1_5e49MMR_HSR1/PF01926_23/2_2e07RsgA_GTPase/PF03193_16/4_9e06RsgA_GTPase/PF03193_16/2_1e02FeoB_N/PF02421_18/1_1e05Roc/PF08477_13/3_1e05Septin/PF00735_18/9_5e05ABC_tran/PF00005_27/2_9e03ABC_tran/PF00005_27/0_00018AIG1/PF04548_16/0_00024SRPRB/PF09439_10/0_0012Ar
MTSSDLDKKLDEAKRSCEEHQRRTEAAKKQLSQAEAQLALQQAEYEEARNKALSSERNVVIPWPKVREIFEWQNELGYKSGFLNCAVCGSSGSGKSSLVNSLRGLRSTDEGAAASGHVETTMHISSFTAGSSSFSKRLILFDVPGAGTLNFVEENYFYNMHLYVFDCILVVFHTRFFRIDVDIIKNCSKWKIPCLIIRTKSDESISNMYSRLPSYSSAKYNDIKADYQIIARQNVFDNLSSQIPNYMQSKIFLVSRDAMYDCVKEIQSNKGVQSNKQLDEQALLRELKSLANRCSRPWYRIPRASSEEPGALCWLLLPRRNDDDDDDDDSTEGSS